MREILFRGKNIDSNEWVYGGIHITDTKWCIVGFDVDLYNVHKETIGQYTGLKDKKGVKIFEGDTTNLGNIVFGYGCFGIKNGVKFTHFDYLNLREIEIIGNIHDK